MIELIKAAVLGVVEGVTEFLPISSTGHLILVNQFISFGEEFTKMFDVIIQLGAILAVVIIFWERLYPWGKAKTAEARKEVFDIWGKTILAVVPALLVGALFHKKIEELLFNPVTVAVMLVLGGAALILLERRSKSEKISSVAALSYKTALFIGMVQCIAMIPGTSRSAATIIGALLLGCSRAVAVEFSFFLAIPTMVAATGYSLLKIGFKMTGTEAAALAVGFVVSFLTAWAVIRGFLAFIRSRDFTPFGWYRILLGGGILAYFFLLN